MTAASPPAAGGPGSPDGPDSATRVFVYGSCVARDVMEVADPARARVLDYVARQSLVSAASPPAELPLDLARLSSPFQRRMVSGDVASGLRSRLQQRRSSVDLLLWDLTDERLGVHEVPGGWVTASAELAQVAPAGLGRHVAFGTDEHLELWTAAAAWFARLLVGLELRGRTVLLAPSWREASESGAPLPVGGGTGVERANQVLARYVDHLQDVHGIEVLDVDPAAATVPDDHRWGPAPFHYSTGYGLAVLERLDARRDRQERPVAAPDRQPRHRRAARPPQPPALPRRDAGRWRVPLHVHDDVAALETAPVTAGISTVWLGDTVLDVLVQPRGAGTTVVFFHAAPSPGSPLPVFAGNDLLRDAPEADRVYVADPGLHLDPAARAGWYATALGVGLDDVLERVVRRLHDGPGRLLLVGRGTGAVPALRLGRRLPGSLTVAVDAWTALGDVEAAGPAHPADPAGTAADDGGPSGTHVLLVESRDPAVARRRLGGFLSVTAPAPGVHLLAGPDEGPAVVADLLRAVAAAGPGGPPTWADVLAGGRYDRGDRAVLLDGGSTGDPHP